MQMYVYEYVTATTPRGAEPSLEKEGSAMLERLATTLAQLPGAAVTLFLHDSRRDWLSGFQVRYVPSGAPFADLLVDLEPNALWHLVAPETDGILLQLLSELHSRGQSWWGPSLELVELLSDKLESYRRLGSPLVETAGSVDELSPAHDVIVKPRDGCGSMFVIKTTRDRAGAMIDRLRRDGCESELVVQPWIDGRATSIAAIGSGAGKEVLILPMADQNVLRVPGEEFDRLSYRGGQIPSHLDDSSARRAVRELLDRLPPFAGYLGFDLVLEPAGAARVIEINPRLSTSYVGYSHWCQQRTGDPSAMGRILMGESADLPKVEGPAVRFTADGVVSWE